MSKKYFYTNWLAAHLLAIAFIGNGFFWTVVLDAAEGYTTVSAMATSPAVPSPAENLPFFFEAHPDKAEESIRYLARAKNYTAFVAPQHMTLVAGSADTLSVELVGARDAASFVGVEALKTRVNYFRGKDPSQWRRNLETFGRLQAANVYPGIGLEVYGRDGLLEYDFVVEPAADPGVIRLRFAGVEPTLRADGGLQLGEFVQRPPYAYQRTDGGVVAVASAYVLEGDTVGIAVESYDPNLPLVIDPVLVYSTYLGGEGEDRGNGIALDGLRNAYVVGSASSTQFNTDDPVSPTVEGPAGGFWDAFVAKIDPTGTELVYLTFLGGRSTDEGLGIDVNTDGEVWIAGRTQSEDFPATLGAVQEDLAGESDAFVAYLDTQGALVAASFLGGSEAEGVRRGALDLGPDGSVFVVGSTVSDDLNTNSAYQPDLVGGAADAFVARFSADLSTQLYLTYFGDEGGECLGGCAVAVGTDGRAQLAGTTTSEDLVIVDGFETSLVGSQDGFIAIFSAAGTDLAYSTYLGGSEPDTLHDVALGEDGTTFVVGQTQSPDFPVRDPHQNTLAGADNIFVTRLDAAAVGSDQLLYSTYLGGSGQDRGFGIAVDTAHNAHIAAFQGSADFPFLDPVVPDLDDNNALVARFDADGRLTFASSFGGSAEDNGYAITVDLLGAAYVAGMTTSPDLPLAPEGEAIQSALSDERSEALVFKIGREFVESPRYEYTAKVVCGIQGDPQDTRLAPGAYSTIVNIHNPHREPVEFFKKLALAYPPGGQQPGEIYPIAVDRLEYDRVLAVDCPDLEDRLFEDGLPAPYYEGFVVIQSSHSLDVTTVYTTAAVDDRGQPTTHSSIDVEAVRERENGPIADLSIRKSIDGYDIDDDTAYVQYRIEVDNLGPETATGVVVTDLLEVELGTLTALLPASLVVSHGGVWADGPVGPMGVALIGTIPLLPAGDTAVLEFTVRVTLDPATQSTHLIDTAQVTSDLADPDTTNNQVVLDSTLP